jgi:hypothetical protein
MGGRIFRLRRDLGIRIRAVWGHVARILKEEEVADRQELAEKLEFAVSPPLNQEERAGARRVLVREMMVGGCSRAEMMERLGVGLDVLKYDIRVIRRMCGVKKLGKEGRRELGAAAGRSEMTNDEIRSPNQ